MNVQLLDSINSSHNVNNGVDCAHLMEMNFICRPIMDPAFYLGKRPKNLNTCFLYLF